ncbi:phosphatidate cytidylyltransferase [Lutibaculum baratangense]|uniref:phosphatidate cytidylyltransferase n=1 Tax=Lutibaculum baratangense TaxID=1358440 RepID=UPI001FCA9FDD
MALAAAWLGGTPFAIVCAVMGVAITWEWNGITRQKRRDAATIAGMAGVAAAVVALLLHGVLSAVLVLGAAAVAAHVLSPRPRSVPFGAGAAVIYGGLPTLSLVVLRGDSTIGLICVFWLFAVVWAGDVGAYFTGRLVGGPKLWRRVSPNKTWSGAVGGTVAAFAASSILLYFSPGVAPVPFFLPVVLSAVAQAGDLAESALKRHFGAKDSSRLIPGHGGVMDRVDGLAAAAVVGVLIGMARAGADHSAGGLIAW